MPPTATATPDTDLTDATTALAESPAQATIPTREVVIAAVMSETGCLLATAQEFVDTIFDGVRRDHDMIWLSDEQASGAFHNVLEAVMPDEATSVPDTAHDLLERWAGGTESVVTLCHTRYDDNCGVRPTQRPSVVDITKTP